MRGASPNTSTTPLLREDGLTLPDQRLGLESYSPTHRAPSVQHEASYNSSQLEYSLLSSIPTATVNGEKDVPPDQGIGMWDAVWNLTGSIIGSGTLAMPFAISCSGWLLGTAILIVCLICTTYSLILLIRSAHRAGPTLDSYEKLALFFGGRCAFALTMISILVGGLALCMAMLIFVGELLTPAFTMKSATDLQYKVTVIAVAFGGLFPLSLLKSWKKLRWTSFFATASTWYIVLFVTVGSISYHMEENKDFQRSDRAKPVIFGSNIFTTFSMLLNAFSCHLNAVPIYASMRDRSPQNGIRAALWALFITTTVYTIVGVFGYLHFGDNVEQNILDSFWDTDEKSWFLRIANISIALTLVFHLPLAVWPWRSATVSLIRLARTSGVEGVIETQPTNREWVGVTFFLTVVTLLCALFIPSIKIALSICGAWGGAFIVFMLPMMFNYYSDVDSRKSPWPWLLLGFGLSACGISMWHVIDEIARGKM